MRFDKFTIKSQELIQASQSLASQQSHQQIEPEHLLSAMLNEQDGIAAAILNKLGVSPGAIGQELTSALNAIPKVSGGGDVYLSTRTKNILDKAFSEASKMKDEYVSIEHILLAISDEKDGNIAQI
ncbi:MAG: type VI secretion system ATPase TssH, partial [Deltaproteobacteria bacterium]|nr:type VI secretion system ATPase TssH [Deltaproteobacteria bacterium]